MRLDKLLANMGYGSRKEVKALLKQKAVRVDDEIVKDSSLHVDPIKQNITVFGDRVEYVEYIYLMMHKPQGVIQRQKISMTKL